MSAILDIENLPSSVSDDELLGHFGDYGTVESAAVDRACPASAGGRGARVVMSNNEEAQAAIDWLHDTVFQGRVISVRRAPSTERFWLHFEFPRK